MIGVQIAVDYEYGKRHARVRQTNEMEGMRTEEIEQNKEKEIDWENEIYPHH